MKSFVAMLTLICGMTLAGCAAGTVSQTAKVSSASGAVTPGTVAEGASGLGTGVLPTTFSPALNASTVFMGDSITAWWPMPLNNKGIPGQHASEMLARFETDVVGHGYSRVVILAGTNDLIRPIAGSENAVAQIGQMAAMARASGMEPVLCLLPPLFITGYDTVTPVAAMNTGILALAKANGYLLVDYNTPLGGHPEDFGDGVHPTPAGYLVMEAALSGVVLP